MRCRRLRPERMTPGGDASFARAGLSPRLPNGVAAPTIGALPAPLAGFPGFRIAVHGNGAPPAGFPTCRARMQANRHRNSDNLPAKAENPCTGRQQLGKPAAKSRNRCTKARQLGKPAASGWRRDRGSENPPPLRAAAPAIRETRHLRHPCAPPRQQQPARPGRLLRRSLSTGAIVVC